MRQSITRLGMDRSFMLLAGSMSFFLLLLLFVGWIWVTRLPPAPTVLPDPQALTPAVIVLPDTEPAASSVITEADGVEDLTAADDGIPSGAASDAVADISSRPLFWPGRRPFVESDEPEIIATDRSRKDEFDKAKLVGVYFAGPASGVIIEHEGERQRLGLQEELLGWTLEMISANSAVFAKGEDKQKTLLLEHANSAKYTATANPAVKKAKSAESEEVRQ